MKKIYIAGAITNNAGYMEQFAAAEEMLKEKGYAVYNPAKNYADSYKGYIDLGLSQLMECDAAYFLEGFRDSTGAMLEYTYAKAVGLEIITEEGEITMNESVAKPISISIEEYTKLKYIETRFAIVLGIERDEPPLKTDFFLKKFNMPEDLNDEE